MAQTHCLLLHRVKADVRAEEESRVSEEVDVEDLVIARVLGQEMGYMQMRQKVLQEDDQILSFYKQKV